jgi:hypothetical protein
VRDFLGAALRVLGIGALVAGGLAVAIVVLAVVVLIAPLIFWLAWNVLDFAHAVGLPELGFWGIVLATLFLVLGWVGKVVITGVVFLVNPDWFANGTARVHWPEPTFKNFVAVALLALLASRPHAHAHQRAQRSKYS